MVGVEHRQRAAIIEEVQRRGEVIARNLAAISYGPLLLYNYTVLEQNVARVAGEADVVYALVLDADGRVAAHSSHPERVGAVLEGPAHRRAARAGELLVQETVTSRGEAIYDFALPVQVEGRKWGTIRVGLSKQRMEAEIGKTRVELGALTLAVLLLGGLAAALMARRIARPVQRLAEGAVAISRGELAQRIEPTTADEIGRLAAAFNHMAVQLVQQRGLRAHPTAERHPHGDARQPRTDRERAADAQASEREHGPDRAKHRAAQGRRGQGPGRHRGPPRPHARAAARARPPALGPARGARDPRRGARPRDQEPADIAPDVHAPSRAPARRPALSREVPQCGTPGARADQRDRRAAPRAGASGTDEPGARAVARPARPRGRAVRQSDRGATDRRRPRVRA